MSADADFLNAQILRQAALNNVGLQAEKLFAHVNVADSHNVRFRQIFRAVKPNFIEREERHVDEEAEHRRAHDKENQTFEEPA